MNRSLRARLALSYGAVALLVAVSLGAVLQLLLAQAFRAQERRYLEQNAAAVAQIIEPTLAGSGLADMGPGVLQAQVDTLAYLTQTQIRLYDDQGALLLDSGAPQTVATLALQLDLGAASQAISRTLDPARAEAAYRSVLVLEQENRRVEQATTVRGETDTPDGLASPLSLLAAPADLAATDNAAGAGETVRSQQSVNWPLVGPGGSLGSVTLAQGPAVGRVVLQRVVRALALAAAAAFALAAAAGWLLSGHLSRPIDQLATATASMAAGDLSARAPATRQDELGRLAVSFNIMASRVERTVTALHQFVADAAHELHTPLAALRTNLDLAAEAESPHPAVKAAQAEALRLQKLSDDLLDLSRLEAGLDPGAPQAMDLAALLAERVEGYAARAEQAGLVFTFQSPTQPVTVRGQPAQLARALDNLADNALKFTPAGGAVEIGLVENEGEALLTVADTGIGVEAADRERLFSRFHRGRNAAAYPGSGLGLAIAQRIVTAHGGRLAVDHRQPGTVFVIALPLI